MQWSSHIPAAAHRSPDQNALRAASSAPRAHTHAQPNGSRNSSSGGLRSDESLHAPPVRQTHTGGKRARRRASVEVPPFQDADQQQLHDTIVDTRIKEREGRVVRRTGRSGAPESVASPLLGSHLERPATAVRTENSLEANVYEVAILAVGARGTPSSNGMRTSCWRGRRAGEAAAHRRMRILGIWTAS